PALRRFLEYGSEHASNRVALAYGLDRATHAMQLRPARRIDRRAGIRVGVHESQDRKSGEHGTPGGAILLQRTKRIKIDLMPDHRVLGVIWCLKNATLPPF